MTDHTQQARAAVTPEAIEAAAKALWELDREPWHKRYEDCRDGTKRHLQREVTAALEAAAPYMQAPRG